MMMMTLEKPHMREQAPAVRQAIDTLPESVLLTDSAGLVELANDAALHLFDAEASELIGKPLAQWFSQEDAAALDTVMLNVSDSEPGCRLEEISAAIDRPPMKRVRLSIARMRHRKGLCVVVHRVFASANMHGNTKSPVKTETTGFSQFESFSSGNQPGVKMVQSGLPAADQFKVEQKRRHAHMPRVLDTSEDWLAPKVASEVELISGRQPDGAASPVKSFNRDLYAVFEGERERKQWADDEQPEVSPVACLERSVSGRRQQAVSETVRIVMTVDEGIADTPLDEEHLFRLFDTLVERLIAVSPPYCDAKIEMSCAESSGFTVRFNDIGRGLTEDELRILSDQPDLAVLPSHTLLLEAQRFASNLGIDLNYRTSVDAGTSIEVVWRNLH